VFLGVLLLVGALLLVAKRAGYRRA
jgi:hypothetical protein